MQHTKEARAGGAYATNGTVNVTEVSFLHGLCKLRYARLTGHHDCPAHAQLALIRRHLCMRHIPLLDWQSWMSVTLAPFRLSM